MPYQELLIGEWYPVDSFNLNLTGYEFKERGICENKLGYYEYSDTSAFIFSYPYKNLSSRISVLNNAWLDNILYSYGTTTCYSLKDDTLSIYNPSLRNFEKRKVSFISKDTLLLSDASRQEFYVRKHYNVKDSILFDKIIFLFPQTRFHNATFFSISRNGDYFMYDRNYYRHGKIINVKILEEDFEKIEFLFRKANFDELMDSSEYVKDKIFLSQLPPLSRIEFSNLTIVLNQKMFTMHEVFDKVDYENKEFYWAYLNSLFYLEQVRFAQSNNLREIYIRDFIFPESEDFSTFVILKNDSVIDLINTEAFHLTTLLCDAEETDSVFTPSFKVKENLFFKHAVETDGRFFRYKEYGKYKTVDLGFNFIKENDLEKFLREKTDYEEQWIRTYGLR